MVDQETLDDFVDRLEEVNHTELRTMTFHVTGRRPHEDMSREQLIEAIIEGQLDDHDVSPIKSYQEYILDYLEAHPFILASQKPCDCRGTLCPPVKVVFDSRSWRDTIGTPEEQLP